MGTGFVVLGGLDAHDYIVAYSKPQKRHFFFPGWYRRHLAHDSSVFNFSVEKHEVLLYPRVNIYIDVEHPAFEDNVPIGPIGKP